MDIQVSNVSGILMGIYGLMTETGKYFDFEKVLKKVDLSPEELTDNDAYISWQKGSKVMRAIYECTGDRSAALKLGLNFQPHMLGNEINDLLVSSPDYMTAGKHFTEFSKMVGEMLKFWSSETDDEYKMSFIGIEPFKTSDRFAYDLCTELSITTIHRITYELSLKTIKPKAFEIEHTMHDEVKQVLFQVLPDLRLIENANANTIVFDKRDMIVRRIGFSQKRYEEAKLKAQARLDKLKSTIKSQIQDVMINELKVKKIVPTIHEIAKFFNKEERTLMRILTHENTTYTELKDQVRKNYLIQLIEHFPDKPAKQLSTEIGLQPAAFSRWFVERFGVSYKEYVK